MMAASIQSRGIVPAYAVTYHCATAYIAELERRSSIGKKFGPIAKPREDKIGFDFVG